MQLFPSESNILPHDVWIVEDDEKVPIYQKKLGCYVRPRIKCTDFQSRWKVDFLFSFYCKCSVIFNLIKTAFCCIFVLVLVKSYHIYMIFSIEQFLQKVLLGKKKLENWIVPMDFWSFSIKQLRTLSSTWVLLYFSYTC